ncbi:Nonribosomal peptide synthetase 14 [Grifola frondosa]|uniref:Nonribosomal peptide synthetase 14 n=1 Tax=Grifola frondosa TaxID=5627 RepID=A0A1C7M978_GRIFR|nr:Nonribosomal peptide synthetase 14 [Grifola frondosa]
MFTGAMQAIVAKHPNATYVEIGPHPVLVSYISSMAGKSAMVTCALRRPKATEKAPIEVCALIESLGKLIVAGHNCIKFDVLFGTTRSDALMPIYPFARKEVPYLAPTPEVSRQRQRRNGPLNYPQLQVNAKTHPALADHIIKGEPIMPAAGYMEMALEFGARKLWNVEFISLLALSSERPTPVEIKLDGSRWSVNSSAPAGKVDYWPLKYDRLHARGYMSMNFDHSDFRPRIQLDELQNRLAPIDMKGFYETLASFAEYGPTYRRILSCSRGMNAVGKDEVLVKLRGMDDDLPDVHDYRLHPAILDAALHVVVHPLLTGNRDKAQYYLPDKVGALIIHDPLLDKPFPRTFYAHATFSRWTPESIVYDILLVDEDGIPLCSIEGLEVAIHGYSLKRLDHRYEVVYERTHLFVTGLGKANRVPICSGQHDVGYTHQYGPINGAAKPNGHPRDVGMNGHVSPPVKYDTEPSFSLLHYHRGEEMQIQQLVKTLDPLSEICLWFVASAGLDGDASLGFTRSLRKEYRSWTIRVAVFDAIWTGKQMKRAVGDLVKKPGVEDELWIDSNGSVFVPRIVQTLPPRTHSPFQPDLPWKLEKSSLRQVTAPHVPDDHVLVHVVGAAHGSEQLWSYVGSLQGSSGLYAGVASGPLSNVVVAHRGSVVEIPMSTNTSSVSEAPCILSSAIAILAVGLTSLSQPERLRQKRVVVTHSNTVLGSQIVRLYAKLNMDILSLPSQLKVADLRGLFTHRPNIIISGSQDAAEIQILKDIVARGGELLLWNQADQGVARLLNIDPWLVGDALRCAMNLCAGVTQPLYRPLQLANVTVPQEVPVTTDLFNPAKSYLLIGGIGSLGLQIALWMYQKGAREITLTSRSGRNSLVKKGDFVSLRLLTHLEGLPGVLLRTEAVDALSHEHMLDLVRSFKYPLGGCMILSVVLVDRTFASQTPETFEAPFSPKVGAFRVLESILPIESLDFLIAFSSVSGMFGNAGQTNYARLNRCASANTALAGLTRKYKNAMTLVSPAILDTSVLLGLYSVQSTRLKHLSNWGITSLELCGYIEDGLRKLREGPVWQYIPDFDWRLVHENIGSSPLYAHLIPAVSEEAPESQGGDTLGALRTIVCKVLDLGAEELAPEVPFTAYGLDSLSAAALSYALRPFVAVSQIQLLADLTLRDIEARLQSSVADTPALVVTPAPRAKRQNKGDPFEDKVREMRELVEKLASDLPSKAPRAGGDSAEMKTVMITGTTGSLGAHALAHLLQSPLVSKVYAILRMDIEGVPATLRQVIAFESRGLETALLKSEKLVIAKGALHEPSLGLSPALYEELRHCVTHILHLGWPVNFGLPLASYVEPLYGLRRLVDLASSSDVGGTRILFASTHGMFRRKAPSTGLYVGTYGNPVHNPALAVGFGYSESKWAAEQLLSTASERSAVSSTAVRIGQLAGGKNGAWNTSEWFPSMVAASYAVGCAPAGSDIFRRLASALLTQPNRQNVSWLPADTAAEVIIEMMDSPQPILHLRHPRPMPWSNVMSHISAALNVPLVPYREWFARLEQGLSISKDTKTSRQLEAGLRLLEYYRPGCEVDHPYRAVMENNGLAFAVAVDEGCKASTKLRNAGQIDAKETQKWMRYWRDIGYLPHD